MFSMVTFSTLWNGQNGTTKYDFDFENHDGHMIITVNAEFFNDPKPVEQAGYLMGTNLEIQNIMIKINFSDVSFCTFESHKI